MAAIFLAAPEFRAMGLVPTSTTAAVTTTSAAAIATTMAPTATSAWTSTPTSGPTASSTAVTATIATALRSTSCCRLRLDAIEIGLVAFFEFSSAFKRQSGRRCRNGLRSGFDFAVRWRRWRATAHLCALFPQNCFARKPNAVAFNSQYLHQYLVVFFQFVA